MADITLPYTFSNGATADATQVNANFSAVTGVVNGNLDTTNIGAAGINVSVLVGTNASIGTNGSIVLPGNLILKWGTATSVDATGGSASSVSFATAFPNNMFCAVVAVENAFQSNPKGISAQWDTPATTGFNVNAFGADSGTCSVSWIAIGN